MLVAGSAAISAARFVRINNEIRLRLPVGNGFVTLPAIAGLESSDAMDL